MLGKGVLSPFCLKSTDSGVPCADKSTGRGEVPVGRGALDETFDLAFENEKITAAGQPQAGVFLDCSKCYERIPLQTLETFALESGYPLCALYAALDMYAGRRRVLLQGAVSAAGYRHSWYAAWLWACGGPFARLSFEDLEECKQTCLRAEIRG
eukprot:120334-Amphidinium_carterae.2